MSEIYMDTVLKKISKAKHKYCGSLDENGFRTGTGCQEWFKDGNIQNYSGQFLCNNLHNKGVYSIDKKGDQAYYDGCFYANKLEGYGKVVDADRKIFEGLFKQHVRFGPGIMTYPDDTQDVGMWDGFALRRITVPIGNDFVPRLGRTFLGKAKLLKYREMVPVCNKVQDKAKKLLEELNADEEIVLQSDDLYNLHIRNGDSLFFNTNLFEENFTKEECTIDVVTSQEEAENGSLECIDAYFQRLDPSDSSCNCFQAHLDKFGYTCVQLRDVEIKLQAVLSRKDALEEQLRNCKDCCEEMKLMFERAALKNAKETKLEPVPVSQSKEITTILKANKTNLTKSLSFYSSLSDENESLRSEIELKSYIYTHSDITDDVPEASDLRFSRQTLPFFTFSLPQLDLNDIILNTEIMSEEGEMSERLVPPICYCNAMLIENINIIQEKLKSLNQEELFYLTVKNMLKKQLDIEFEKIHELKEEEVRFVKKVIVTHLLSWNNEKLWISMLQHCFRHRFSENNVSFSVNNLLKGYRKEFNNPGIYEADCRKFLEDCGEGNDRNVFDYMRTSRINPDLCDVRGNTGLMLATVRDKVNVISVMVNCGSKVDAMNDEGLTPLTLSFLKYISMKLKVSDWEKAFLQETGVETNLYQWFPAESVSNVSNESLNKEDANLNNTDNKFVDFQLSDQNNAGNDMKTKGVSETRQSIISQTILSSKIMFVTDNSQQEQKYIFNMDFIRLPKEKIKKKKAKKDKKKKKKAKKKKKPKKPKSPKKGKTKKPDKKKDKVDIPESKVETKINLEEEKYKKKLDIIKKTIMTLLHHGSDPNIGDVPLQPIFLAVFTDDSDFIFNLLKNNADPNAVIYEDNLTCLHVIVSLKLSIERAKMCDFLLKHKADPNIKTSSSHWPELKKEVLGEDFSECPNEGKNALHILSLREDYNDDADNLFDLVAGLLVSNKCDTTDLYLGHTPLSLAVLRGNIKLIKTFLESKKVDAHQLLGNEMGNALTVLILDRFSTILTPDIKNEVAQTLFENGLNPLHEIGEFENVIAFMENEVERNKLKQDLKKGKNKGSKKGGKKDKKKSSTKKTKSFKKSKKGKKKKKGKDLNKIGLESVKKYIFNVSKNILYRHLQSKAVQCLYILLKEEVFDPIVNNIAKFVTPDEALDILRLLFQNGIVREDQFCVTTICNFYHFVKSQQDQQDENAACQKVIDNVKNKVWTRKAETARNAYLPLPEVDQDIDKYKICFRCLKGRNKTLLKCPSCELVYFCSDECNHKESGQYHKCQEPFYDSLSKQEGLQQNRLEILLETAKIIQIRKKILHQLKDLNDEMLRLTFITSKRKQRAAELMHILNELQREEEHYVYVHSIQKYTPTHEHQYVDKIKLEEESINLFNLALSSHRNSEVIPKSAHLLCSSILKFARKLPPMTVSSAPSERVSSRFHSSSFSQRSRASYLLSGKHMPLVKKFIQIPKEVDKDFIMKVSQEQAAIQAAEALERTKKGVGKLYYTELLSKIFADFNLPLLLLPYACYKDGQVYYSMGARQTNFPTDFHQLTIPD